MGVTKPDCSGLDYVLIVLCVEMGHHGVVHRAIGFREVWGPWRRKTIGQAESSEHPGAAMSLKSGRIGLPVSSRSN